MKATWGATVLSHALLHSSRFILHGLANGLLLFFLGRELVPLLGARRFLGLLVAANLVGALAWLALHWQRPGDVHLGVTAGVCGLLVVFAAFNPQQRVDFLLFFLWPVTLKARHIVMTWLGLDLLGLFLHEIPATPLPLGLGLSHSAHLGGMIAGLVYFRFVHHAGWFNPLDRDVATLPAWLPGRAEAVAAPATATAGLDAAPPATSPAELRAEVDRILDKITSEGLASLTPAERRLLDEARHNLPRR
ncbi:MAG: rhomboid family intramembrane serine protease [Opitutaceae bacterium]|nr:rhomboid family intramembrane serine protease [Opitutaceae bacterium]